MAWPAAIVSVNCESSESLLDELPAVGFSFLKLVANDCIMLVTSGCALSTS